MAALDDLELDRPTVEEHTSPPPRRGWMVLAVAAALAAGAAAAWFYWPRGKTPEVQTATEETVTPQTSITRIPAEPGDDIDLPPLAESDALVRELVARLSSHPTIAAWLTTDHLIRDFVAIVVNISQGDTPAPHLSHVRPDGSFRVRDDGGRLRIDARSYSRYDRYASAVAGLDARGAARLYATLRPRIDEAYQELGAPDGTFDRTMEKAIVRLLQTPVVEGVIPLRETSVVYAFADPALESLSPAQRQFLRMGPANMRVIQAKLREIAGFLGSPVADVAR